MASLTSHAIKGQGSHRRPGEAPVFLAIGPDREPWWAYTMPPGWGGEEGGAAGGGTGLGERFKPERGSGEPEQNQPGMEQRLAPGE